MPLPAGSSQGAAAAPVAGGMAASDDADSRPPMCCSTAVLATCACASSFIAPSMSLRRSASRDTSARVLVRADARTGGVGSSGGARLHQGCRRMRDPRAPEGVRVSRAGAPLSVMVPPPLAAAMPPPKLPRPPAAAKLLAVRPLSAASRCVTRACSSCAATSRAARSDTSALMSVRLSSSCVRSDRRPGMAVDGARPRDGAAAGKAARMLLLPAAAPEDRGAARCALTARSSCFRRWLMSPSPSSAGGCWGAPAGCSWGASAAEAA